MRVTKKIPSIHTSVNLPVDYVKKIELTGKSSTQVIVEALDTFFSTDRKVMYESEAKTLIRSEAKNEVFNQMKRLLPKKLLETIFEKDPDTLKEILKS